jgi:hypothetical protein
MCSLGERSTLRVRSCREMISLRILYASESGKTMVEWDVLLFLESSWKLTICRRANQNAVVPPGHSVIWKWIELDDVPFSCYLISCPLLIALSFISWSIIYSQPNLWLEGVRFQPFQPLLFECFPELWTLDLISVSRMELQLTVEEIYIYSYELCVFN